MVVRLRCPTNTHIYFSLHAGWRGSGWNNLSLPIQFYVNDVLTRSCRVEFTFYTEDTPIIATFCQPGLPVNYQETYLNDIAPWVGEWRIAFVSKSTVMLFA